MEFTPAIIIILWGILSLVMFTGTAPYCKELKREDKILVMFIFIIGGPCFAFSNVLQEILNNILPEGWDSEDDFKGY